MDRRVEPELLDTLPATDSRAAGSRRDLQRLNFWMGQGRIAARQLRRTFPHKPPRRLIDLGGGDGKFLLDVCRRLGPAWQGVHATIVDRYHLVAPQTLAAFSSAGWQVQIAEDDLADFFRHRAVFVCDLILANLVLHHFAAHEIRMMFAVAREFTSTFLALEPRRSPVVFAFSRAVGLIGCNQVTRHDAPASVVAGFNGNDLSQLWPQDEGWSVEERAAGLFSHLFLARKIAGPVTTSRQRAMR